MIIALLEGLGRVPLEIGSSKPLKEGKTTVLLEPGSRAVLSRLSNMF